MKRHTRLSLAVAALLLTIPLAAQAQQQAQVIDQTQMFAGPDTSYPLVATLMPGTYVAVEGCTEGYQWCDTIVAGNRGWVPGSYLDVTTGPGGVYYDRPQPIYEYGADIGVPIVAFTLGMYWDRYYHNRPFYHDRDRWYRMPPPRGRMPGPPHNHFDGYRPDIRGPGRPEDRGGPGHPGPGPQPRDMRQYQPQRFDNNHYQPQHGGPGGQPYRPANMPQPYGGPHRGNWPPPHGGNGNGGHNGGGDHEGGHGGDHGGHGDGHKDDKH